MNPILALIITNLIWGAASPIFKYALTNIPPFTLAFIRFFFASLLFLPFCTKVNLRDITKRDWFDIFLGAFFGISINVGFFFLGVQKTESINVPIIASTGPLFIFLFSVIFLGEKPKFKVLAGMILSFIGALGIIFSPIIFDGKTIKDFGAFEGNLMIVLATLGSVIQPVVLKNVMKRVSPYFISLSTFFIGALTFIPLMMSELDKWSFVSLNLAGVVGIIFGVFFSSALAYFLFYYGLSKISTQEVGLFTYIDPVVAILIAVPLLGEYPNLYFFLGSILIFGGIFIAENRIHWHPFHKLKIKSEKLKITV